MHNVTMSEEMSYHLHALKKCLKCVSTKKNTKSLLKTEVDTNLPSQCKLRLEFKSFNMGKIKIKGIT